MKTISKKIIVDNRWYGEHGIGRFAYEVISRLKNTKTIALKHPPLSIYGNYELVIKLLKEKNTDIFFTPGFNPPLYSKLPFVFVIHDLIHLNFKEENSNIKSLYYNLVIKLAAKKAYKILTDSAYSKSDILKWLNINGNKIIVVGCGVSEEFLQNDIGYQPGYPFLFCLGNIKPHKNLPRIIHAFAKATISKEIRLIIATKRTPALKNLVDMLNVSSQVVFVDYLAKSELPKYYKGAIAFLFPSLYEGFGLPIIEAMASGTAVVTANLTAMPEIAKDAALLVDPYSISSIAEGIEEVVNNNILRQNLIDRGYIRVRDFSWDKTANIIQNILDGT